MFKEIDERINIGLKSKQELDVIEKIFNLELFANKTKLLDVYTEELFSDNGVFESEIPIFYLEKLRTYHIPYLFLKQFGTVKDWKYSDETHKKDHWITTVNLKEKLVVTINFKEKVFSIRKPFNTFYIRGTSNPAVDTRKFNDLTIDVLLDKAEKV